MNRSKAAVTISKANNKVKTIIGWVVAVFGALGVVASLFPTADKVTGEKPPISVGAIVVCILIIALGVFLIKRGADGKKLVESFHEYVRILSGDPENKLSNLAEGTNQPVQTVKKNLQSMIKKKFFTDARIDEENGRLVLGENTFGMLNKKVSDTIAANEPVDVELVTVTCSACGGKSNIPVGRSCPCEYCGTILRGE